MNLKEKYSDLDLSSEGLEQLTAHLLEAKFDAETRKSYIDTLAEKHGIQRPEEPFNIRRRMPLLFAIAAAFALLIYALFALIPQNPSALELADNYLADSFPGSIDLKGQISTSQIELNAIKAYDIGDYEKSAQLRTELLNTLGPNSLHQFYLGLSLLYQTPPKLEEAITSFELVLNSNDKKWQEESQWFYALALVKANRIEKAKIAFQKIIDTKAWNNQEAVKLLEVLE